jgi:membrane-associated protein
VRTRAARVAAAVIGVLLVASVLLSLADAALDYFEPAGVDSVATLLRSANEIFTGAGLLLIEEAGVPLPLPGDVIVMYMAHSSGPNEFALAGAFIALEVAVLLGSTFLYLVARRYGRRLAEGHVGEALHLNPKRLATAERWLRRWGFWAVFFGRHIPGGRVAMTVVGGSLGLALPTFVLAVGLSTAIWLGFWMAVGLALGPKVQQLAGAHRTSSYLIPAGFAVLFFGYLAFRLVRVTLRRRREGR